MTANNTYTNDIFNGYFILPPMLEVVDAPRIVVCGLVGGLCLATNTQQLPYCGGCHRMY